MKKIDNEYMDSLFLGMYSHLGEPSALGEISQDGKGRNPFRVLISTIISQRTRDEETMIASKRLFDAYDTPEKMAGAKVAQIEKLIRNAGFYRQKAPKIREVARIIHEEYGDKVPETICELTALPGVGRKTANCVLVFGFGKAAIPVDTHVHRISNRLGLVATNSPDNTETELLRILPEKYWLELNDLFVRFGKAVCRPIGPRCGICKVIRLCDLGMEKDINP